MCSLPAIIASQVTVIAITLSASAHVISVIAPTRNVTVLPTANMDKLLPQYKSYHSLILSPIHQDYVPLCANSHNVMYVDCLTTYNHCRRHPAGIDSRHMSKLNSVCCTKLPCAAAISTKKTGKNICGGEVVAV